MEYFKEWWCCSAPILQEHKQTQKSQNNNLNATIFQKALNNEAKVIQIKKSQYEKIYKDLQETKKQFIDTQFSFEEKQTLGSSATIGIKWKRISDIVSHKFLISDHLDPKKVSSCFNQQGKKQTRGFLSAVAALTENKKVIENIFQGQKFNKQGIYKVALKINGQIQEIIVDDLIPVNQLTDKPIYCLPTCQQIWVPILEKAWAKALGSYSNLIGKPTEVFKAITFAPSQQIIFEQKGYEEQQIIWDQMLNIMDNNYPCICFTTSNDEQDEQQQIDLGKVGLAESQLYILIGAQTLMDKQNFNTKVVKLKTIWSSKQVKSYKGPGSQHDTQYWDKIKKSENKQSFLKDKKRFNDEKIFTMTYDAFYKYFDGLHVSLYDENNSYTYDFFNSSLKNGLLYKFDVKFQGTYVIQLHQNNQIKSELKNEQKKQENLQEQLIQEPIYKRSTLILVKQDKNTKALNFQNGFLTMSKKENTLSVDLTQGKYLIYTKLDDFEIQKQQMLESNLINSRATLSIYASYFTMLVPQNRENYPELLQRIFIQHARRNKVKANNTVILNEKNEPQFNIVSKRLLQQGGFAYCYMYNQKKSSNKYVLKFNEKDFNELGFKLKKPYKNKTSDQIIEILPGEEKIIIARMRNEKHPKSLNFAFPPKPDKFVFTKQVLKK